MPDTERVRRPKPQPAEPGQESVWDYPRPPALVSSDELVRVWLDEMLIAETRAAKRILETAHAPAYYLPREDVRMDLIAANPRRSWCEFKGQAHYGDVDNGTQQVREACWWYPDPSPGYQPLAGMISFYPQRMTRCEVDGETVTPLPSNFYGDWPTSKIAGPYKGAPGTEGW